MADDTFHIEEHTFEGQHIREYPRAIATFQEDTVQLHAKSYTPHAVANGSRTGDLTIIAFHANAFHKEVYEPFFTDLYHALHHHHGLTISSIWIADQTSQGTSGLLNDSISGNDPSWFDHSRDVICMVNTFRKQMRRPIVGVGHSMGGTQAVAAAHFHPRLFEALVLIDAPISLSHSPSTEQMMQYALRRPETHDSCEQAAGAVRRSPMFKEWDPRVVKRFIETAFHSKPTVTAPNDKIKPTTTKHAEASTLVRSQIGKVHDSRKNLSSAARTDGNPSSPSLDTTNPAPSRPTHETPHEVSTHPRLAWSYLPTLRPSVYFLHGTGSRVTRPDERPQRTAITGTAPGGSGGEAAGRVGSGEVEGGHFAPMTRPQGTAGVVGTWVAEEVGRWERREEGVRGAEGWEGMGTAEKQRVGRGMGETWRRWEGNGDGGEIGRAGKSRL